MANPETFETTADGLIFVIENGAKDEGVLGSYAIRVYTLDTNSPETKNWFLCGIIAARAGEVNNLIANDIDADGRLEILVQQTSHGDHSYHSAQLYEYTEPCSLKREEIPAIFILNSPGYRGDGTYKLINNTLTFSYLYYSPFKSNVIRPTKRETLSFNPGTKTWQDFSTKK